VNRTRGILATAAGVWLVALTACQYGVSNPTTPSNTAATSTSTASSTPSSSGTSATTPPASGSTLTYTADIQPILASDCVSCHGPATRAAGIDLSTYAGVMRTVTPGSANSLLILVTRSGGLMYSQFRGNRPQKAATISDWIIKANAAR
jgi:cytochrome c553